MLRLPRMGKTYAMKMKTLMGLEDFSWGLNWHSNSDERSVGLVWLLSLFSLLSSSIFCYQSGQDQTLTIWRCIQCLCSKRTWTSSGKTGINDNNTNSNNMDINTMLLLQFAIHTSLKDNSLETHDISIQIYMSLSSKVQAVICWFNTGK